MADEKKSDVERMTEADETIASAFEAMDDPKAGEEPSTEGIEPGPIPYLTEDDLKALAEISDLKTRNSLAGLVAGENARRWKEEDRAKRMAALRESRANVSDKADSLVREAEDTFDRLQDIINEVDDALREAGFEDDGHRNANCLFNEAWNELDDARGKFDSALSVLGYFGDDASEAEG